MSGRDDAREVERARQAAARGAFDEAFELLVAADKAGQLTPADLPLFGDAAYASGQVDTTIAIWERIHAAHLDSGEVIAAAGAAARVAMHLLFDTALLAPVRGWLARAERLLEGQPETPAHAWVAVVRTYERLLGGDLDGAKPWAERAVAIGSRCDGAACAIGRIAEARLLILDGRVARGLALLDEVGATMISGDLDPLSTGVVYCELVCALQGLAQYDLAEEWTSAMERWAQHSAIGSLHGRCRVHRAEILRLRGSCDEAEAEALAACDELRPYLRRELGWPLSELGRIRLRKGDLDGAERAFLAAHHAGWDPEPGLSLVRLARGDVSTAAASIRDALERPLSVPSKEQPPNTALRRAPLLEAQVEIALRAADIERARSATEELKRIAEQFQSKAWIASGALASGRLCFAEGDATSAERHFAEAVHLWTDVGAPYEAAVARLELARAHRVTGREHQAELEQRAAQAVLEAITRTPERKALQSSAARLPATEAGSTFRLEGDYWLIAFEGHNATVRNTKGMRYLARMLQSPGREFHVLDLVAAESPQGDDGARSSAVDRTGSGLGDAGQVLDEQARHAYRRRLAEIDEDIDEAKTHADAGRVAQAEAEREFLVRELSRAFGLGGKARRASSASERARAGVTRAVRQAMARIAEHHALLGSHLDRSIRTGTYCSYVPDPRAPVDWAL